MRVEAVPGRTCNLRSSGQVVVIYGENAKIEPLAKKQLSSRERATSKQQVPEMGEKYVHNLYGVTLKKA